MSSSKIKLSKKGATSQPSSSKVKKVKGRKKSKEKVSHLAATTENVGEKADINSDESLTPTPKDIETQSAVKKQRLSKKRKIENDTKMQAPVKKKKRSDPAEIQKSPQRTKRDDVILSEDSNKIKQPQLVSALKGQFYLQAQESSSATAMTAMLKECLLGQRWAEANDILNTMCLYQTPVIDSLWKCGAYVMQNHPNSNPELVENLLRMVRTMSPDDQTQKRLEHALYLLSQDKIDDAFNTITDITRKDVKRHTTKDHQNEEWKLRMFAYTGMIEYYHWLKELEKTGNDDDQEPKVSKTADIYSRKAMTNLDKVTTRPGVWDIFIRKHAEILESKGDFAKLEKLLTRYQEKHPTNPNALVYLYEFRKKHHPTYTEALKDVLKKLTSLLPAESYTLEYITLLEETDSGTLSEVLPALFNMADYSSCYSDAPLWTSLAEHVITIVESKDKASKKLLKDCWDCRKPWWTKYHFDQLDAPDLVRKHRRTAAQKAILASVFFGSDFPFVQKVLSRLKKTKPKAAQKLDKEIALWNQPAL